MLNFDYVTLEDRTSIQPILVNSGYMGNENAFGTLFIWGEMYKRKTCRYKDTIFNCFGENIYNFPVGTNNIEEALSVIIADSKEKEVTFKMWGMTKDDIIKIEELMPNTFEFTLDRDGSDYIYNTEDLINLAGRKFHGKRNHLAKFIRTYNYSYEDITSKNLPDCIAIASKWREEKKDNGENDLYKEEFALNKTFSNYEELGFLGGLIKIEGKPVAFTIGEEINQKVFLIHFEKALSGYDGLYAAINHEFTARQLSKYQYVNREEDLGIEGLRKAKLSYNPAILLEKYSATLKGDVIK